MIFKHKVKIGLFLINVVVGFISGVIICYYIARSA